MIRPAPDRKPGHLHCNHCRTKYPQELSAWVMVMRRAAASTAICFIYGLSALLAADGMASAQAGSTGGTLGQTDKSAVGSREVVEPAKTPRVVRSKKRDTGPGSERQAGVSVAGRWQWIADCQSAGHYTGAFQLTQGMSGELNGIFLQTNIHDNGTITDGHVASGIISFTRNAIGGTQHWTGRMGEGGSHINGSLTGNVNCTWEGRKE